MKKIKSFLVENKVLILSLAFSTGLAVIFLTQCVGCTETAGLADVGVDTAEDVGEDVWSIGDVTVTPLDEDTREPSCLAFDEDLMCIEVPDAGSK